MPPRVLLPASFVLGFLLLSAARGDDSGYVRINLTRRLENHMLAPVQLNGRKANFIVDTGAAYSCLDLRKAGSFGLQPKNGVAVTLNGRKHTTTQIDVTSIGPVEIRNLKMVLIDFSEFERRRGSGEIQADGILGLDVLRLGRAVLDCQQLRLFWKAVPGAPNVMASTLRGAGWTAVKLQLKDNLYFANGILNETPTRFVVDTGAFATLVDRSFAARAALKQSGRRLQIRGLHNVDTQSHVAYPTAIAIGGFVLKDFPVATNVLRKPGLLDNSVGGLIGSDVLGKNLGVIDCEQHVLYLKSPGAG
jgi:predicted aspartyl protease